MIRKTNWPAILAVSAVGICLIACLGAGIAIRFAPNLYQYSLENSSLRVGDPAPDFRLASLDGETISLSQFKGQPVLLSFGATWCPDCLKETPLVEELHRTHPELVILLVDSNESPAVVQQFADEFGVSYPVLLDRDGAVMRLYQVFAIPTNLFINAEGVIRAKLIESVTPQRLAEILPLIGINP